MTYPDAQMPRIGDRVVLTTEVDRFPHALVPSGLRGTVESANDEVIALKLDETIPELAEWDNCLTWTDGIDTEEGQTVAEAFRCETAEASPAPAP